LLYPYSHTKPLPKFNLGIGKKHYHIIFSPFSHDPFKAVTIELDSPTATAADVEAEDGYVGWYG